MCQGGDRSDELWEEPQNLAMALLLCCLVHSDIDPPFHLSSFSCAPSSTLHLYLFLSFFLPLLDSRVEEPSGFNREGMKMFIHLEGIRAMIKEGRE